MKPLMLAGLMTAALAAPASADDEEERLPRALGDPEPQAPGMSKGGFSIGPAAGYLRARDADEGTWFGGIQARHRFSGLFALEGSITFHQDDFFDGDVTVTQYPVQVSAILYPFPGPVLEPYVLGGAGWYYTRIDYDDAAFPGVDDDTTRMFAVHLGAGAELHLGPLASAFADFRWLFVDEPGIDNSNLEDEEFDSWMLSFGLSLRF